MSNIEMVLVFITVGAVALTLILNYSPREEWDATDDWEEFQDAFKR